MNIPHHELFMESNYHLHEVYTYGESAGAGTSYALFGRQVELAPATALGFYHRFVALVTGYLLTPFCLPIGGFYSLEELAQ